VQWAVCDENTLRSFSAVGYFFEKKLQENLDVPIGIINASWGATPAEVWTPKEVIEKDKILAAAAAKQPYRNWCPREPGYVYNAMIEPLTRLPLAGVIWYQGESNTEAPHTYGRLL